MKSFIDQRLEAGGGKPARTVWLAAAGCGLFLAWSASAAESLSSLVTDRVAIERVYYTHRTGTKATFEQTLPPAAIESLVKLDRQRETVLVSVYGAGVTAAMLEVEVQRIDATTRAPEVLAELRHALGDDARRFARSVAKPILVERELRRRFDNDDKLHAAQRREAEQVRVSLLAGLPVKNLQEVTWRLAARPGENAPAPFAALTPTQAKAQSNAYTVEATVQIAQVLASPDSAAADQQQSYFEDLDPELQHVLRMQLRQPGDVSAVIETAGGFLVFLAKSRNAETLAAASFSLPKRSYDDWLAQQPGDKL